MDGNGCDSYRTRLLAGPGPAIPLETIELAEPGVGPPARFRRASLGQVCVEMRRCSAERSRIGALMARSTSPWGRLGIWWRRASVVSGALSSSEAGRDAGFAGTEAMIVGALCSCSERSFRLELQGLLQGASEHDHSPPPESLEVFRFRLSGSLFRKPKVYTMSHLRPSKNTWREVFLHLIWSDHHDSRRAVHSWPLSRSERSAPSVSPPPQEIVGAPPVQACGKPGWDTHAD